MAEIKIDRIPIEVLRNDRPDAIFTRKTVYNPVEIMKRVEPIVGTRIWIDKLKNGHIRIILDQYDLMWLQDLRNYNQKNPIQTIKIPVQFYDKFLNTQNRLKKEGITDKLLAKGWFVKGQLFSMKYTPLNRGPYRNLEDILFAISWYHREHSEVLDRDGDSLEIYLIPWVQIDMNLEFRVFVYNSKLTAIGMVMWMLPNNYLNNMSDSRIKKKIRVLIDYCNNHVIPSLEKCDIQNAVLDIALINGGTQPYFIEVNMWGPENATNSGVFWWYKDKNILESDGSTIVLRFPVSSN